MKQALHIFEKDARGLWPQIALVAVLFGVYAMLSPEATLSGAVSVLDWGGIPAVLIVLACWTLGASVMHEDAAAEQSPFWLTRPYSRRSLVVAKVLFLFVFVFLPLVLCGVILEARSGVGIAANLGSLLGLCFLRSVWLILPALALGALTRNLMEFATALCGLAIILAVAESRLLGNWVSFLLNGAWQQANIAGILPMAFAAIAVVGLQYAVRRTQWNQGILLIGVVVSGLLIPMSSVTLLSLRASNPGFDPTSIRVAFDPDMPKQPVRWANGFCFAVPLRVEGLPADTLLRPIDVTAELSYPHRPTYKVRDPQLEQTNDGDREIICRTGTLPAEPPTLRTSIHFAVVAVSTVASVPARRGTLEAGDAGRCEIVEGVNTQLRCALAEPVAGTITAGLDYPGNRIFTRGLGGGASMRLSPVLRARFDGAIRSNPGGWDFDNALRQTDARFVLRNERVIGSVWRELVYERLDWSWWSATPPPPPPPPAFRRGNK